ncbi:MAG: NeuD/PglB/VioB family sugar acetyltransferase [Lachnospiraceae bacterium]|nr:NeuD/PglB/VioB family sugar acetyltransferase [Lachnospiraceae bacterium]MBQ3392891.1 NeuD/PglB/VioB family sugar acetyltransferase [Lachnospiraceae bacterium]
MKDIMIVGAGGCGREVANWIEDINKEEETWTIRGFLDDNPDALKGLPSRYPVIGPISGYTPEEGVYLAMGIANPAVKHKVARALLERGAVFARIIHPSTRIYTEFPLGEGLVTYPNCKISTGCRIGDFVTIQSTIIGHDVQIENYVTVSSSCGITGGCRLHEECFIADHAAIAVGLEVGARSYVGIGSVVIRSVEEDTKVFGNPARVFQKK